MKVSIITINKNNSDGLEKTIQSVINQTYFNKIEYIVIDGLSSDRSSIVIDSYKNYLDYYSSELDSGIYNAMNKGVLASTGEYLLFLNSGDTLYNNSVIERIYNSLSYYDIIYGGVEYEGETTLRIAGKNIDFLYFSTRRSIFHQSAFISRKLLLKQPYDESFRLMGDVNFFFNAICVNNATYKRIPIKIAVFAKGGISSVEVYNKEKEKTRVYLDGVKYIKDEQIKRLFLKNIKTYNRLINELPIDFVFPYVDNTDPIWLKQYGSNCRKNNRKFEPQGVRYRNYDSLKYLLRGVEKNIPWIRNIYIIVEQESQVPEWLNKDNVKIIYHKDIIPEYNLPTYNSGTIEMYLKNINGLSEYFIYSNDDMFPISPMNKSDFFNEDGLPVLSIQKKKMEDNWYPSIYESMVLNSNKVSSEDLNKVVEKNTLIRWNHTLTPMRKSTWQGLFDRHQNEIERSCSIFRSPKNMTQELVNSWQYLSNNYDPEYTLKSKYIDIGEIVSKDSLLDTIKEYQVVCINDSNTKVNSFQFENCKRILLDTLKILFPDKSKYEK